MAANAAVDAKDDDGRTPLHEAAYNGYPAAVTALVLFLSVALQFVPPFVVSLVGCNKF